MDEQGIARIARLIGRHVGLAGQESINVSRVRNALAARDREHFVEATAAALKLGYVVRRRGSDHLHPGAMPPDETRLGLVADLDAAMDRLGL